MKRLLSALVLASGLLSALPVRADGTIDVAKSQIDSYVEAYFSTDSLGTVSLNPGTGPIDVDLPKGMLPYTGTWMNVFRNLLTPQDHLRLFNYAGPGNETYGEMAGRWADACAQAGEQLKKLQSVVGQAAQAANVPGISSETNQSYQAVASEAQKTALTLITDPTSGGLWSCAKAMANMYYALRAKGFICISNVMSDPGRDPANGAGDCVDRRRESLQFLTVPNCSGSNCTIAIRTNPPSQPQWIGRWYAYYASPANQPPAGPGKTEQAFRATIDKKISELEAKLTATTGQGTSDNAAAAAAAQRELNKGTAISLPLPLSDISVPEAAGRLINGILGITGSVALLLFLYGGLRWMTARGSPDSIKTAKMTLVYAALGLLAIFGAYAVISFLITNLG